jgi:hypothetical protein
MDGFIMGSLGQRSRGKILKRKDKSSSGLYMSHCGRIYGNPNLYREVKTKQNNKG